MTLDSEARNDYWSIERNLSSSPLNQELKLCVPEEESFPKPLEYIDVVRRTNTTSEAVLESRNDDYWNVDGSRHLSEPWTGFTQFIMLNEGP